MAFSYANQTIDPVDPFAVAKFSGNDDWLRAPKVNGLSNVPNFSGKQLSTGSSADQEYQGSFAPSSGAVSGMEDVLATNKGNETRMAGDALKGAFQVSEARKEAVRTQQQADQQAQAMAWNNYANAIAAQKANKKSSGNNFLSTALGIGSSVASLIPGGQAVGIALGAGAKGAGALGV